MSEQMLKSERLVQKQVTDGRNLSDNDEIIDVSGFDFGDNDKWLYIPQCSRVPQVYNLYTWLSDQPGSTVPNIDNTNRKCIDTRTFVRPKKKTSRASFEVLFEAMTPLKSAIATESESAVTYKQDSIPSMLKTLPSHSIADGFLLDENGTRSGQESMEVFLNMSHSKGIDSFINLTEPGFSDPIMNISQPSIFYSSITSLARDDSLINSDQDDTDLSNAGNYTHTITQINNDLTLTINTNNIDATFLKTPNTSIAMTDTCESKRNETFTNHKSLNECKLNETYRAENTLTAASHENVNVDLSSTYVNKCNDTVKVAQSMHKEMRDLNSTYMSSNAEKNNSTGLNRTYVPTESEFQEKDHLKKLPKENVPQETVTLHCPSPSVNSLFAVPNDEGVNSTFKLPFSLGPPSIGTMPEDLNSTFNIIMNHVDQAQNCSNNACPDVKEASSLRQELLQEIKRSEDNKLDTMQKHIGNQLSTNCGEIETYSAMSMENIEIDIPLENKLDTMKLDVTVDLLKNQSVPPNGSQKSFLLKQAPDRKFYTFTKKNNAQHEALHIDDTQLLDNANTTFTKQCAKAKNAKSNMPRAFSKLPQFLQKSNPNLLSGSSKSIGLNNRTGASNLTFMKGSQPNIVKGAEKSLSNKEYNLGKMRSGSEQRLVELNTNPTDFQPIDGAGSTDSVNSTQSAHSAPDLDDRLSVCSDSSHNSYATQLLNVERFHQIARLQEESLRQESTPKGNRRVLENTWIELKTNLPSPILKNGVEHCGKDSPSSTVEHIKTSSPLLSPTGCTQPMNTDGQPIDAPLKQCNDVTIIKKSENISKATARCDNKTRLRLPTNFYSARAPTSASAIPRPPSRIPALRFTRPVLKNMQSEGKEG